MSVKLPGILPPQVTDKGYLGNPLGGLPFPGAKNMPTPMWEQTPGTIQWVTADLPPTVFLRGDWTSPIFDLRPDFRGLMGTPGTQRNTGTQPIWLPRGVGGRLWLQVDNLEAYPWNLTTLRVTSTEFASIRDGNDLQRVTDPEDITTELVTEAPRIIGSFLPPGSGYPVRFWKVRVRFEYLSDLSVETGWPNPQFRFSATYY